MNAASGEFTPSNEAVRATGATETDDGDGRERDGGRVGRVWISDSRAREDGERARDGGCGRMARRFA